MKPRDNAIISQSRLMRAIYGQADGLTFDAQGLAVYQRSLTANAKRALSISFPTIHQLLGNDCFTLLASDFLYDNPLNSGDWGEWGDLFPDWLSQNDQLGQYPYLSDCAQLDWLVHQCEREQSTSTDISSLALLEQTNPYQLRLKFAFGTRVLASAFPIVDIWEAHQTNLDWTSAEGEQLAKAALSLSEGKAQAALVWRPEWKASVQALSSSDFSWLQATLAGNSIGDALDAVSHTNFSFENWLPQALQNGLVRGIDPTTH